MSVTGPVSTLRAQFFVCPGPRMLTHPNSNTHTNPAHEGVRWWCKILGSVWPRQTSFLIKCKKSWEWWEMMSDGARRSLKFYITTSPPHVQGLCECCCWGEWASWGPGRQKIVPGGSTRAPSWPWGMSHLMMKMYPAIQNTLIFKRNYFLKISVLCKKHLKFPPLLMVVSLYINLCFPNRKNTTKYKR